MQKVMTSGISWTELTDQETQQLIGGGIPPVLKEAMKKVPLWGAFMWVSSNWQDIKAGAAAGWAL